MTRVPVRTRADESRSSLEASQRAAARLTSRIKDIVAWLQKKPITELRISEAYAMLLRGFIAECRLTFYGLDGISEDKDRQDPRLSALFDSFDQIYWIEAESFKPPDPFPTRKSAQPAPPAVAPEPSAPAHFASVEEAMAEFVDLVYKQQRQ